MWPREDSYGVVKRLMFVTATLRAVRPRRVLDIGCGTGAQLTTPLAREFPQVGFIGVDSDTATIEHARRCSVLPNLGFQTTLPPVTTRFDVIIASEVIEHVERPGDFLCDLRGRLSDAGRLVLTLPNGYGPFELAELVRSLLVVSGAYRILRRQHGLAPSLPESHTLATSPHINFFSFRTIARLVRQAGFTVERYAPRTVFCGLGFDRIVGSSVRLLHLNAYLADHLPPAAASDWMFVLKPEHAVAPSPYERGVYAKFRRGLNEKAARVTAAG